MRLGASIPPYTVYTYIYVVYAQVFTDKEWSYEKVLPYFKKIEQVHIAADSKYRGFIGPVDVSFSYTSMPIASAFIKAHNELGMKTVDYNGERMVGVQRTQRNMRFVFT